MTIEALMHRIIKNSSFNRVKNDKFRALTIEQLEELGVPCDSEFYNFYSTYFSYELRSNNVFPVMVDVLFDRLNISANMAWDIWKIPKSYILFTTGEGEGGYLYNTEDNSVWDFNLGQQDILGTDRMRHWNSFYEFMEWYLTVDE